MRRCQPIFALLQKSVGVPIGDNLITFDPDILCLVMITHRADSEKLLFHLI